MGKIKLYVHNQGLNELPEYATHGSVGLDLRADLSNIKSIDDVIGSKPDIIVKNNTISLFPGGRVLIPTGLHVNIPDGYEIQIRPRSGLAIKHGITVLNNPGTIDSDYRGDIGVILYNTDKFKHFEIKQGDKIAQAVLNKISLVEWDIVSDMTKLGETERGEKGFGHSGQK